MKIIKTGNGQLYVKKGRKLYWIDGPIAREVTLPPEEA